MNKEQFRKELELALKSGIRPKQDKFIKEYIDARLAAIDDVDGLKEYYVPIPVTKFGDLPTPMTEVVVFFKNRKEPWVAYREIDNIWFFETGEPCKTPTHWLKKIKK